MASLNLSALGASGPLEALSPLTALTDLRLASNNFSGAASAWCQSAPVRPFPAAGIMGMLRKSTVLYCAPQAQYLLGHGAACGAG